MSETQVAVTGLNGSDPAAPPVPMGTVEADPRLAKLRTLPVAQQIKIFRALRDRIKERKKLFEAQIAPDVQVMSQIAGLLQEALDATGAKKPTIKTEEGTCFYSTKWTTSVADKEAFMNHVIATQDWSLLDKRANVTAVKAYAKKNKATPPGVKLTGLQSVRVRKAGEPAEEDETE